MNFDPETTLAQAGPAFDASVRAAAPSEPPSGFDEKDYPTRGALEETLADLDGGAGAVACATGSSARSTVTRLFDADAHVLCARDCSAETIRHLSDCAEQDKGTVSYVDVGDPEAVADAVRPATEALWIETPSRSRLRVADLEALSEVTGAHDLLMIVDNTFLSPLLQRPLEHGADLVVYSSIAYLSGHSDVAGGAIVAQAAPLAETLQQAASVCDAVAPPFESWLVLRGARTLPVRMRQHETSARSLAHFLDEHPAVDRVYYPGLRDHPGHATARRQQDGYGGMISFVVDEARVDVDAFLRATEVFATAETPGGVESLVEHPTTMSCASMAPAQREAVGVTDGLLRLSVGLESTDDLTQDLDRALEAARSPLPIGALNTNGAQESAVRAGA